MVRYLLMGMVLLLTACASSGPKKPVVTPGEEKTPALDQGLHAMEQEDYAGAAQIFDRLLVQKPASEVDLVILYNSAAAQEGLGNCAKASERYRQVVRSSAGKFSRIEGEALYRSSLMYECLGQDTKTITSLLDTKRRAKELSFDILNAEIPARLAAAYARMGNREKALQYFTQASRGLKQVVSQNGVRVKTDRVARTLFLMGKLNPSQRNAEAEPTTYLQSVSMQQPYLLQSIELGDPTWSPRAADDLKVAYDNVWKFKIEDPEKRREFYTRTLQTINELRKIRMPRADPKVDTVFAVLDQTERQVQNELSRFAESNPLTPEAQKRQGLRREGRLIDPNVPNANGKKKKPASRQ